MRTEPAPATQPITSGFSSAGVANSYSSALPIWLLLLAISILINYVDRGNLAVAAPLLKDELRLTNTQLGVLITAFFWTYTVVLAVSGWICDRFNVKFHRHSLRSAKRIAGLALAGVLAYSSAARAQNAAAQSAYPVYLEVSQA
ncbi:MAG TPA: MFS transporter [Candidatus Acidoferrum sp.]|jgi:sugar phosphate permease